MTDREKPYQPVTCAVHSEYELAIMQRRPLHAVWRDANQLEHIARLLPLDLKTEQHAEFLYAQDSEGHRLKIRLDYIKQYRILE